MREADGGSFSDSLLRIFGLVNTESARCDALAIGLPDPDRHSASETTPPINPLPHQTFGWREADFVFLILEVAVLYLTAWPSLFGQFSRRRQTYRSPTWHAVTSLQGNRLGNITHDIQQNVCTVKVVFIIRTSDSKGCREAGYERYRGKQLT